MGPFAFARPENAFMAAVGTIGPPLIGRLGLSDDQVKRIQAIVDEGEETIAAAARFPIAIDPRDKPTIEDVRRLVEGPVFREAREQATRAGRRARAEVIRRIEDVLTEPQRRRYRERLGAPFDLDRLNRPASAEQQRRFEVIQVGRVLGLDLGQRADPEFRTWVDSPGLHRPGKHPRVLFDEAHFNFHTAGGRYRPFAELIAGDGYLVIPGREKFSREVLRRGRRPGDRQRDGG